MLGYPATSLVCTVAVVGPLVLALTSLTHHGPEILRSRKHFIDGVCRVAATSRPRLHPSRPPAGPPPLTGLKQAIITRDMYGLKMG